PTTQTASGKLGHLLGNKFYPMLADQRFGPVISVASEDIHLAERPIPLKGTIQKYNPKILPWAIVGIDGKIYLFDPWDIETYQKTPKGEMKVTLLRDRRLNLLRSASIAEYLTFFSSSAADFSALDLYQVFLVA
ncbi:MAG: hypothetical protein WCG27_11185, partial [Pseudomonadota bacterium]